MERVIVDIHPEDAYYDGDEETGKTVVGDIITLTNGVPWEPCVDYPGWEGGDCIRNGEGDSFYAIKTVALVDYPGQEGQMKQKERITPYGNLYKRKLRLRTR